VVRPVRGARHDDQLTVTLLVLVIVSGALAQAVSGIGFGLVTGPVLVGVLGHLDGVRLSVLLSTVVNLAVLAREHQHVRRRSAVGLLLPAAIATPLLAVPLRHTPEHAAEALAGLAALVGATALASGVRWQRAHSRGGMVGAAVVSAAMNDAAGIGGPAVALWADNAGWSHDTMRGTLQVYFLGLNAVAIGSLGLPHQPHSRYVVELAALVGGLTLGHLLARWISPAVARRATLSLAGAGGLVVLLKALLGLGG
jgi:uncharacterized membrane protein YfcA